MKRASNALIVGLQQRAGVQIAAILVRDLVDLTGPRDYHDLVLVGQPVDALYAAVHRAQVEQVEVKACNHRETIN